MGDEMMEHVKKTIEMILAVYNPYAYGNTLMAQLICEGKFEFPKGWDTMDNEEKKNWLKKQGFVKDGKRWIQWRT